MAAPYTWLDDARTTAASPRSSGGATLVLADGTKFGAPSPSAPIQVAIRRSDALVVVLLATARSGSSLTISGPAPGYSDAAVQAGDDVLVGPTAADMAAIWAAIDGKQGSLTLTTTGSSGAATLVGSTLNIPQYSGGGGSGTVTSVSVATANGFGGSVANATTTPAITITTGVTGLLKGDGTGVSAAVAGTDYLTGNQTVTLGGDLSGSGTTSITATIASNAVTTAKVNNNAITYAKLQTAASAGVVGASAAGNYGHVTIGAGLSLSGGVLSSTVSGTVTSVGLTVPTGLSVSGSPVTGSGTLAVTLGVSGLLKGSAGAIVAAGSGDVTTSLINDKAVTYAKIADATGAGLLGATGAGAHQLLTIGSGLSLVGTTLSASTGATEWSMVWTTSAYGRTAVGAIDPRPRRARSAAVPVRLLIYCESGAGAAGCSIQITVDGVNLLSSALTLAPAATLASTTSFAVTSIPVDAVIKATATAMDGATRGVVIELVLQKV